MPPPGEAPAMNAVRRTGSLPMGALRADEEIGGGDGRKAGGMVEEAIHRHARFPVSDATHYVAVVLGESSRERVVESRQHASLLVQRRCSHCQLLLLLLALPFTSTLRLLRLIFSLCCSVALTARCSFLFRLLSTRIAGGRTLLLTRSGS